MTEERINALRKTDTNLRDALKMDEAERPQMPADLNERLMKRVANEEKKPRRIIWHWIAAACVAGVMMIWLMPPKDTTKDVVAEKTVVEQPEINKKVEETKIAEAETKTPEPVPAAAKEKDAKMQIITAKREPMLLAKETPATHTPEVTMSATPTAEEAHSDLSVTVTPKTQEKTVTLTERDIPMTRPENYKYTPEELALMRKQANEAYLKWAELELEIAKYNLEQTAQK